MSQKCFFCFFRRSTSRLTEVADALRHLDLLKQVLHEEMPPSVASAMRGRVAEIEEELIRLGYGKKVGPGGM